MKCQLPDAVPPPLTVLSGFHFRGHDPACLKHVGLLIHDMSTSLPNLAVGVEAPDCPLTSQERPLLGGGGSISDMLRRDSARDSGHGSPKRGSFSETARNAFGAKQTSSLDDGIPTDRSRLIDGDAPCGVAPGFPDAEFSSNVLRRKGAALQLNSSSSSPAGNAELEEEEEDLVTSSTQNNNRLSAVLENMELLYLPGTKQLVSRQKSVAAAAAARRAQEGGSRVHELSSNGPASVRNCDDVIIEPEDHGRSGSAVCTDCSRSESGAGGDMYNNNGTRQPCSPSSVTTVAPPVEVENGCVLSPDSDVSSLSTLTIVGEEAASAGTSNHGDDDASSQTSSVDHGDCDCDDNRSGEPPVDELTKICLDRNSRTHGTGDGILPRTDTDPSLAKTDASSFSSISSLSTATDLSTSAASASDLEQQDKVIVDSEEAGFVEISLQTRNSYERTASQNNSQDSGIDVRNGGPAATAAVVVPPPLGGLGAKPKKKAITSFLARSLFFRKAKDQSQTAEGSTLGWKLFGKVPPKQVPSPRDPEEISQEFRNRTALPAPPPHPPGGGQHQQQQDPSGHHSNATLGAGRVKKSDVEAPSTTALILQHRPQGLPSKDPEEEERHRQEYEAMVEAAKKKELRDTKMKKRRLQRQLQHEEALASSLKVWNSDILPNWEAMSSCRRTRELWWQGIPPSVRGRVWQLAFGNDLNLTPELYEICLTRAKDRLKIMREAGSDTDSLSSFTDVPSSRESSVELIKLDVSRTFPQLCIFQKGGPYYELLQGLLGAYACYRPDVGYVQGMSFIAAVLLLNMEVDEAFICFANLLNRPCQIAFFRLDESLMKCYFDTYEEFFEENLPKLYQHFRRLNVTSDLYIIDWMFTLYAKSLPLDVASRVWDVFSRDGEEFLFRTALGILKLYEHVLMEMDFIHLAQYLTRLPESLPGDDLFRCIAAVRMSIDKRRFGHVLQEYKEQCRNTPPEGSTDS